MLIVSGILAIPLIGVKPVRYDVRNVPKAEPTQCLRTSNGSYVSEGDLAQLLGYLMVGYVPKATIWTCRIL